MPLMSLEHSDPFVTGSWWKLKPLSMIVKNKEHGWTPILWVIYLGFFFVDPILSHPTWRIWLADGIGAAIFLVLYLGLFAIENPYALGHIAGMVLLGVAFMRINDGAGTFFMYAAAMLPFCVKTQTSSVVGLAIVGAVGAITGWVLQVNYWSLFYSSLFPVIIGAGNTFFAERNRMNRKLLKASEELERLAKVAERERIARDLHDVLGHTLSVITLKSELAGKLLDRNPERAKKEMYEVEEISRQALSDVRAVIRGYRAKGLAAEMAQAKSTLETAGLTVQCEASTAMRIPALQESVLCLAVREAVTNVVRHAHASSCRMRLEQHDSFCRLEVHDDGQGFSKMEGNGLRGMRERTEMLGGTFVVTNRSGTVLIITLPLKDFAMKEGGGT